MPRNTKGKIIFHNPEGFPHVSALEAVDVENRFPRHVHSSYVFTLIERGRRYLGIQGRKRIFSAGEMSILPPGTSHECDSVRCNESGPHSYRAICVSGSHLQKLSAEITGKPCAIPVFDPLKAHTDFDRISFMAFFEALEETNNHLEIECRLNSFLYHAISNLSSDSIIVKKHIENADLERVRDYIRLNFREKITLAKLSEEGGINPFHLQKQFVKHYGISPQEMVISCRVKYAEQLLRNKVPLTQTAIDSGFSDQSHFSRHFKKVKGISPGSFLKDNVSPCHN